MEDNNKRVTVREQDDNYTHNIVRLNERSLDRRGFMKTMVGAAGLFAISTLPWGGLAAKQLFAKEENPFPKKKIADVATLAKGEAMEFHYPSEHESALIIRVGENEYKAYQNACTHLKCPVFWGKEEKELLCPCHHGKFDVMTGKPVAGPPRRPLPEITVQVENGVIYATGVKPYEA
ncbi:Rieske (2Fe-2S) protein [Brevibacillus dissolubilis]|uniref:Rieske (2Fe-2S) protein n=1 Tax=Brevibacillus dissolubilis TaxID=1844116 RepID=UPI0011169697|nr:Rieske (2Fe-2S) protein [Brevibacillus dissolubilis]